MFDWLFSFDGGVIAVIIPIVIIALLFAYAASRVKVAGANEALVRTGGVFGGAPAQLKAVRAGRVIVLPLVHKLGRRHQAGHQGRGPGRGDGEDRRRRGIDPERGRAVPRP